MPHALPAGCHGARMCPEPCHPLPGSSRWVTGGHCPASFAAPPRRVDLSHVFSPAGCLGAVTNHRSAPGSDEVVRLRRIKGRHFLQTSENFHVSFLNPDRYFNNRLKFTILVPFPSLLSPLLNAATQPHSCCPVPTSPKPPPRTPGGSLHHHLAHVPGDSSPVCAPQSVILTVSPTNLQHLWLCAGSKTTKGAAKCHHHC